MKSDFFKKGICILAALVLTATGCGNDERKAAVSYISEKYSVPSDDQLIVYTSHKEEVYLPIIQEFEAVTGICVTVKTGGTAELFGNLKEASEKGLCDVMFGGGIESYEAAKDCFMPYATTEKERLDPEFLSEGDHWTPFTELPLVFVYNNKLVSEKDAPKSWSELLDEKWKGKIAFADIHKSGTSYTIISTVMQLKNETAQEVVKELADLLDGKILSSSGEIIPYVSNGNCLVGITLEETARKKIAEGYDIAMTYPSDGTSAVPDGCGMVKNAPHSYNAGRFVDFIVARETQTYAMEEFKRRPVRMDVELPEEFGMIKRIDFDIEDSAKNESRVFELWDELISGAKK
ncbi:MAG: extracellular solute-binding protein [Lachnospiraceae bacterium]|nr:extracellular solute-binding protein [Lachnospiraceae bacterium]